jgi:hypothetical protein
MENFQDRETGIRPFDLKYGRTGSLESPVSSGENTAHSRTYSQKYKGPSPTTDSSDRHQSLLQLNAPSDLSMPFSSQGSTYSTIQTTSTPTLRQAHLQQEADDLREQLQELQRTGMQGMQEAMTRMMAYIQVLESHINSDWAIGLTDEPPPMYSPADSRLDTCELQFKLYYSFGLLHCKLTIRSLGSSVDTEGAYHDARSTL